MYILSSCRELRTSTSISWMHKIWTDSGLDFILILQNYHMNGKMWYTESTWGRVWHTTVTINYYCCCCWLHCYVCWGQMCPRPVGATSLPGPFPICTFCLVTEPALSSHSESRQAAKPFPIPLSENGTPYCCFRFVLDQREISILETSEPSYMCLCQRMNCPPLLFNTHQQC